MSEDRIGIWFLGARGGVATTALIGLLALRQKLIPPTGLVSELPGFSHLPLAGWDQFVVGGHEIRQTALYDESLNLLRHSHVLDADLIHRCRGELEATDRRLRPGVLLGVGPAIEKLATDPDVPRGESVSAALERVTADLHTFRQENQLRHVIVVNVASTEPLPEVEKIPPSWKELSARLGRGEPLLPASSLYAVAAFDAGCSYINFTPSLGALPPAINELALERGQCHAGRDGKTGETLLKSVLAPMFAHRHLEVMSWVGHNIFGNMDGLVLDNPENKKTKVQSKDQLLHKVLGYSPQTLVSIEYIKSLGDWKTAWDHIHFRGFLGTPMVMQFIWQGCDSILAAPLVLDLIRFTELAARTGQRGILTFLASFFKSPMGTDEHDFHRQFQMLESWASGFGADSSI